MNIEINRQYTILIIRNTLILLEYYIDLVLNDHAKLFQLFLLYLLLEQ